MKEDLVSKGYGDWTYNRLKDRPLTENNTLSYNVAANARLDIDLFKGLKFSTGGMYIVDHAARRFSAVRRVIMCAIFTTGLQAMTVVL